MPTRHVKRFGSVMGEGWQVRGAVLRLLVASAVLATSAGCGFLRDLTEDEPLPTIALSDETPDRPAAPPAGPVVIAAGSLADAAGTLVGAITVTTGSVVTGLVPPVPSFADACPVAEASLQYLPVDVAFTVPGLAARLDVSTGPDTPSDIGDVGVVVESGDGSQRYCAEYPPLPTADRFWNTMGAETVTGYVVLDEAVTNASPDGLPDVFPTLRLRISDLRVLDRPGQAVGLVVDDLSVGAPCPDDDEAICVALG